MKAEEIFAQALEMTADGQRDAFVASACGTDAALLAKVQGLLKAHDEASRFLEQSLFASAATIDQVPTEGPGTIIGPYKLLQEIGHGGMGVVCMAEQHQPVKRRVALKIIKPGMDSRQIIARFEAERQALSMMDHPNIAKVLDAGTTSSGRPYFVMELVKGQPITQYCDEHHMTPRQRLELLLPVCQAIQHAHQKGIIHRDIKPSNILVAEYDSKPVPKVIDFGVAKAIHQPLTDKTMFTGFGHLVGTLEYMSPEQAKVNQLDIDTRSDIYSLGVLMYELLTGSTPFDRKRLKQAAWDEMLRIIREEEPQRPSTRISTTDELPSIAVKRGMEPKKLSGLVHGELDWIVMKALDKDRNRRYETANGFAMDVQRYLADEAVSACPPSKSYRLRKFIRRNHLSVMAASLILLALVVGIIGTTWGLRQAQKERDEKEIARHAAEENFQRSRQVVDEYFTLVSQSTLFNVPGLQPLRKELLEKARNYYEEMTKSRPEDGEVLAGWAMTHFRLAVTFHEVGRNDDALKAIDTGLQLVEQLRRHHPNEVALHQKLAGYWRGSRRIQHHATMPSSIEGTRNTLIRFANAWTTLRDENPNCIGFHIDLASIYGLLGDLTLSIGWPNQTLEIANEACQWFEKAEVIIERMVREDSKNALYRESQIALYRKLSRVHLARRDEKAQAYQDRALEASERLVADFPQIPQYREDLGVNWADQGTRLLKAGKEQEAEVALRKSIQVFNEVTSANLGTTSYGIRQWLNLDQLRPLLEKTGRTTEYGPLVDQLVTLCRKRHQWRPEENAYREELVFALDRQGSFLLNQNQNAAAEAAYRESIPHLQFLIQSALPHFHANYIASLCGLYQQLGHAQIRQKTNDEAVASFQHAVELFKKLLQHDPRNLDYQSAYAACLYESLGPIHRGGHRWRQAEQAFRTCLTLYEELASKRTEQTEYLLRLGSSHFYLAEILNHPSLRQSQQAQDHFRKCLEIAIQLLSKKDTNMPRAPVLALSSLVRLSSHESQFEFVKHGYERMLKLIPRNAPLLNDFSWFLVTCPTISYRDTRRAETLAQQAVELAPQEGNFWNTLGVVHFRNNQWQQAQAALERSMNLRKGGDATDWFFVAMIHAKLNQPDDARKWFERASAWMEKNQPNNMELLGFRKEASDVLGLSVK